MWKLVEGEGSKTRSLCYGLYYIFAHETSKTTAVQTSLPVAMRGLYFRQQLFECDNAFPKAEGFGQLKRSNNRTNTHVSSEKFPFETFVIVYDSNNVAVYINKIYSTIPFPWK